MKSTHLLGGFLPTWGNDFREGIFILEPAMYCGLLQQNLEAVGFEAGKVLEKCFVLASRCEKYRKQLWVAKFPLLFCMYGRREGRNGGYGFIQYVR